MSQEPPSWRFLGHYWTRTGDLRGGGANETSRKRLRERETDPDKQLHRLKNTFGSNTGVTGIDTNDVFQAGTGRCSLSVNFSGVCLAKFNITAGPEKMLGLWAPELRF